MIAIYISRKSSYHLYFKFQFHSYDLLFHLHDFEFSFPNNACLEYKSKDVMLGFYKALVRLHFEHSEQFLAPYLRKDVLAFESVQRRFTRMNQKWKG